MLRPLLSMLIAASVLPAVGAPVAAASDIRSGATPLAIASVRALPGCPSAAEVDGSLLASTVRDALRKRPPNRPSTSDLLGPSESSFLQYLAYAVLELNPSTTIAVCDPDHAAAGRPANGISGAAAARPTQDLVGFGLRMLGAPIGSPAAGASAGDRFVLPAVGPRATLDLAVRTITGVRSLRLGPFPAAPTAAKVTGTGAKPVVVVELADGTSVPAAVTPPSAVRPVLSARVRENGLLLRLKAAPGAFLTAETPRASGDLRIAGFDDRGALEVADTKGRATAMLTNLRPSDTSLLVSVLDPERRSRLALTCRLKWKKRALRSTACSGAGARSPAAAQRLSAERTRYGRALVPGTIPRLLRALREHRRATGVTPPPRQRSRAARAGVPAIAPVTASTVARLRGIAADETYDLIDSEPLVGDVNGDGTADFGVGTPEGSPGIALSRPAGWRTIPIRGNGASEPRAVPDLTGDGTDDIVLDDEARLFAGQRSWATSPPRALDLAPEAPLGPADLSLSASSLFEDGPMMSFPEMSGDGRPEIGVSSPGSTAIAVFASEGVPLGRKTDLPIIQATSIKDDIALLATIQDEDTGREAYEVDDLTLVRGGVLATNSKVTRSRSAVRSTLSLRRFTGVPPWTFSPATSPIQLAGDATVDDFDPASGATLVRTTREACERQGSSCVERVRRIDAAGAVIATASVRAVTEGVFATFASDGPDADPLPEVLMYEAEPAPETKTPVPGLSGTIALWPSSAGSVNLAALPVLGAGTKPLVVTGPLVSWLAPNGSRVHAGYVASVRGSRWTAALTQLTPPPAGYQLP